MIQQFLRKVFDTSEKEVRSLLPIVETVNALEADVQAMSDDELKATIPDFRRRLSEGESLDKIAPEVFAIVREVSLRTLGMRQFDVQILGGLVLHQGRIAEMKTGEGKTLVAVAPMVLNAIAGKGAHLVTVNDYLARRDATWMGPVYNFLGLSVGIIQGQSVDSDELGGSYIYAPGAAHNDPRYMNLIPCSRREAYLCDITYGTNHEFGFDYLRDNMAFSLEQLSMRELNYAIVDEVDSILIDEARTPHIISGPSNDDVSVYRDINKVVVQLTKGEKGQEDTPGIHYIVDKKGHNASLTEEGMDTVEELLGIDNIANDPKIFHHVGASIKAHGVFTRDIDYVVRGNEVVIVDENTGRMMFGRRYSDGLHQALEAKEGVPIQRESQTVATITFQNLFRMYDKLAGMTGTAKTEEDEFRKIYGLDVVTVPTHRPLKRIDNEDVVYKTLEAKYRGVTREILRLYSKQQPVLVGTRSIEMSEVVSDCLKPDYLQKLVLLDRLYAIAEDKGTSKDLKKDATTLFETPIQEVNRQAISTILSQAEVPSDIFNKDHWEWFRTKHSLPAENETYFMEAIKHGVPHNVLNAKYHEREALIIGEAGRKGAVTIATNMAGRGVDILLGGRVADAVIDKDREAEAGIEQSWSETYADTFKHFRRGGLERAAPPLPLDDQERRGLAEEVRALGGLYILGTERHESRRIDNQLRGRAGRQGDPGESRFFVSLEDMLWKIFNAKMLDNPLLKGWPPMEEVKAGYLSKMILKTQERIENHFFELRKHVLEYDDVLNAQREHVYGMRREVLLGKEVEEELLGALENVTEKSINTSFKVGDDGVQEFSHEELFDKLNDVFPVVDHVNVAELIEIKDSQALLEKVDEAAHTAYRERKILFGEKAPDIMQHVMLQAINDQWMEHLQMIDYIREGINLRAYGQVDPLVAYKRETYDLFKHTTQAISDQAIRLYFRVMPIPAQEVGRVPQLDLETDEEGVSAVRELVPDSSGLLPWPEATDPRQVGRNDSCPCGSGKKFKGCHYMFFREQNII